MSRMSESPKGPNARTQVGPDVEFSSPGRESVVACFDERRSIGHRIAHIVMRHDRSRSCCLPGSAQQGSSMRCSTIRFVRTAYADVARGISRMSRATFATRTAQADRHYATHGITFAHRGQEHTFLTVTGRSDVCDPGCPQEQAARTLGSYGMITPRPWIWPWWRSWMAVLMSSSLYSVAWRLMRPWPAIVISSTSSL